VAIPAKELENAGGVMNTLENAGITDDVEVPAFSGNRRCEARGLAL
jgi:hypothetical protein